jgi:hypothetical protein
MDKVQKPFSSQEYYEMLVFRVHFCFSVGVFLVSAQIFAVQ